MKHKSIITLSHVGPSGATTSAPLTLSSGAIEMTFDVQSKIGFSNCLGFSYPSFLYINQPGFTGRMSKHCFCHAQFISFSTLSHCLSLQIKDRKSTISTGALAKHAVQNSLSTPATPPRSLPVDIVASEFKG